MPDRRTELHFRGSPDGDPETISLEFEEDEWSRLEQFVDVVERVESARMVREGRNVGLNISWSSAGGLVATPSLPESSEIAEFLHLLRPLILQREPASFAKTVALLGRRLDHPVTRQLFGRARARFNIQPSGKRIPAFLAREMTRFDPDQVVDEYKVGGFRSLPRLHFQDGRFRLEVALIPKKAEARGKPSRPIGVYLGGSRWGGAAPSIYAAVNRKATRYGQLPNPFIVAVNSVSHWGMDRADLVEALFGVPDPKVIDGQLESSHPRPAAAVWWGPKGPQNTRVSAVLYTVAFPWGLPRTALCLFHNPWASRPLAKAVLGLPHAYVGPEGVTWIDGIGAGELLSLPEHWPKDPPDDSQG